MASFWDNVRRVFGSRDFDLEAKVRQAMLSRAARRASFTAMELAGELTAQTPGRSLQDLKTVSELVARLFTERLLESFNYARDGQGSFVAGQAAPLQSPPPGVPPPTVVTSVRVPVPGLGKPAGVGAQLRAALLVRAGRKESLTGLVVVFDVARVGTPEFVEAQGLIGPMLDEVLPGLGYVNDGIMWRPPGFSVPAPPPLQVPAKPVVQPRVVPEPPPLEDGYLANPEVLGLSQEEHRQRALRINPYRTAWIGRVDTIPPQTDERTALIDRGLVLRGLLTELELAEIHRVGDLWLRHADADKLAAAVAAKSGDEAVDQLRAERAKKKVQKVAEAAARRQARAEAVARRRAEDITFLGRGGSRGLADRRANVELLERAGLPVLSTPAELARAMGLSVPRLRWLAFHAEVSARPHYVYFEIPKRSGGVRRLAAPHEALKAAQRWILTELLSKVPVEPEAHGFLAGRSVVTNARPHVGQAVVVNVDVRDFFPTISYRRVRGLFQSLGYSPAVATVLGLLCTEPPRREVTFQGVRTFVAAGERCLPQGAPTSPAISNLIARRLDRRLRGRLGRKGWVYTRYADDLSFSAKDFDRGRLGFLHASIRHVLEDEGFAPNPKKGRVQSRGGRQEVTGVVVNDRPTIRRDEVRRLRAVLHQAKHTGLEAQNREQHPDFRRYLEGRIAWVTMVDPVKGAKLKAALEGLR
jgi:hypothetical protein